MKRIILLLLVAAFVASCNNSPKPADASRTMLVFATTTFEDKSVLENREETTVKASIPIATGDDEVSRNINNKVFNTVRLIVSQEDDTSNTYDELFRKFVTDYESFVNDNPDYALGWDAEIEGTVIFFNSEIINIQLDSYTMTGGAHGNSNKTSLIFSPKDGRELSINDIVKDTVKLAQLSEKKFREKYDIPVDKNINSTGLMFPDNKFILPQSIFITNEGLILFYNSYEIASYADGTKEIIIPYSEIKDNLLINI